VTSTAGDAAQLLAISDLHIGYPENRALVEGMRPGTDDDWHRRFRVHTMVYGHLHIPRTTFHEGVRFEEVSVGYPREWSKRSRPPGRLRRILPGEGEQR
jgi:hypothetical protein